MYVVTRQSSPAGYIAKYTWIALVLLGIINTCVANRRGVDGDSLKRMLSQNQAGNIRLPCFQNQEAGEWRFPVIQAG